MFAPITSCEVEEEALSQDERLTSTEELTAETTQQQPDSKSNL